MKPSTILTTCISLGIVLTSCNEQEVQQKVPEERPVAAEPGRDPAVASRIREEIGAILGRNPESIRDTDAFIKDLGADSLDTVEIVMATEEAFDIYIEDAAAEKLVTVGDLIDYVSIRIKTAPGSLKKAGTKNGDAMDPPPDETPIKLTTKFVEIGSGTEELDFDWIVNPFEDGASVPAR